VWLTPERLFEQDRQRHAEVKAPEFIILPTPAKATHVEGHALDLKKGLRLELHGIGPDEIAPALAALKRSVPLRETGAQLDLSVDAAMKPESYRIRAGNTGIAIAAADAAGASYALRSLAQQAAYEQLRPRPFEIEDSPRFGFRGLMLDIARNF